VNNALGYLAGVLLHVAFKWASWKKPGNAKPWRAYWTDYLGLNVAGAIAALVFFGLWDAGFLHWIGNWAARPVSPDLDLMALVPINAATSAAVGYLMDSMARTIWMRIQSLLSSPGASPQAPK